MKYLLNLVILLLLWEHFPAETHFYTHYTALAAFWISVAAYPFITAFGIFGTIAIASK